MSSYHISRYETLFFESFCGIIMKMALEGSSIMNEIVSELLDGVKTGDRVRVRFGNGSSQEVMEGTIERWSDYF